MKTAIPRIENPEIFLGFVSPIGADLTGVIKEFKETLEHYGYDVFEIKVTSIFKVLKNYINPPTELVETPLYERYNSYIKYGNEIRKYFSDDASLAATAISLVHRKRIKSAPQGNFEKRAFLVHQFKRKEEIDLLRSVYGRLFFQVSVYSRRGARVDFLAREFAKSSGHAGPNKYKYLAEKIVQEDENEIGDEHGQRVAKIFHDADFIVSRDSDVQIRQQVERFCKLIFGSNEISPNKMEYGMFLAKAAALRTLDLSRQVGAAIFSDAGEIITLGSNEVPKAGGGTYWADEKFDDREYVRQSDSNFQRKREILSEVARVLAPDADISMLLEDKKINDSQFMDALEYGRIVHAEMSALSDAARLGRAVKDGALYCTTFPCHMCAKHIVAAGIKTVVFLEPYPKSLAFDLHADSLEIEGGDRGAYKEFPSVKFEHFFGVTPRRYREFFERSERKDKSGRFLPYKDDPPRIIVDIKQPLYFELEEYILACASECIQMLADNDG